MELKTTEEVLAMSAAELATYREQLDAQRLAFRAHCQVVGDRFRELQAAIGAATKLGCAEETLRATPGTAVASAIGQAMREQLGPTIAKGGALMAEAMTTREEA